MKRECAVIGHPISHSLSPEIHRLFARQFGLNLCYEKIEGRSALFESQVQAFFQEGGKGLNVTLPFKERAYQMAATHGAQAHESRAANTLFLKNGRLHAENTDGLGFVRDIENYLSLEGKRILVLGAGGAACGIIPAILARQAKSLVLANRTFSKAQALSGRWPAVQALSLTQLRPDYDLIINASAVGLTNDKDWPFPEAIFSNQPFVYDLSYNRAGLTRFLSWSKAKPANRADGLGMLIEQAALSFFYWHGLSPQTAGLKEKISL